MAKKKKGGNKEENRQSRKKSAPSEILLMSLGVAPLLLKREIPEKGPHKLRIVT